MASICNVVVATDFSRTSSAAIERGAHLAVHLGSSLCLLHACDETRPAAAGRAPRSQQRQAAAGPATTQAVRQALAATAASLAQRLSVGVTPHCEAGSPSSVIEAYVKAHPGSLVVVGSRADLDLEGLGSTASEVVRMPAAPTLVVRALEPLPYGVIVSAVDLRAGSVRAASLAVEMFRQAHHHLLYALDPVLPTAGLDGEEAEEKLRSTYDATKAKVELGCRELARQLSASTVHPVRAVVADDVPERAILVAAANLGANCVVVGHHGEGPATNRALGSMAEHVIHSAISDVLVVP
jgi:nucleotide-binding universal stress UspA family protein